MNDHDRFAAKNAALGRAFDMDRKAKEQEKAAKVPKVSICEACGKEKPTLLYRSTETNRTEGAASYGVQTRRLCEDCKPKGKDRHSKDIPSLDPKSIKALLRGARKGLK